MYDYKLKGWSICVIRPYTRTPLFKILNYSTFPFSIKGNKSFLWNAIYVSLKKLAPEGGAILCSIPSNIRNPLQGVSYRSRCIQLSPFSPIIFPLSYVVNETEWVKRWQMQGRSSIDSKVSLQPAILLNFPAHSSTVNSLLLSAFFPFLFSRYET